MGEMKPTPGPWTVLPEEDDKDYIRIRGTQLGCRYKIANVHMPKHWDFHDVLRERDNEESQANARLIAEAGTVFHNTGLSPVQLVEQRDELMAACKKLVEWDAREKDHAIGFMERINLCETAFQMMYAALAKCEGVKP